MPTAYRISFDLKDGKSPAARQTDLAANQNFVRRDVIIGGTGNDALQGGPGEDWIFGGEGNDVISGGYDRQASDLLFGGAGDDSFQILPDDLPFLAGTTTPYIPTLTDRMDGGAGNDRVLFQGGDFDRLSRAVPDNVAIRWDALQQRYEFTALQWDIANQRFVADESAVTSSLPASNVVWLAVPNEVLRLSRMVKENWLWP